MSVEHTKETRVYRFHDLVAVEFDTGHRTHYLTQEHAAQLGGVLAKFAEDIRHCKFLDSTLEEDGYTS